MTEFLIDAPHDPFALLVLAHGAGAPMDSAFMNAMAARLAARGVAVARFEFPYMARRRAEGGKRPPDRMPVLLPAFSEAARAAQARFPGLPLALGGKSMGGRAAAMAAPEIAPGAVLCLGYPFHAAGKAATPERLSPLLAPPCPVLLVQGERDALGSAADVAALALPPAVRIAWIADGDHSLKPRKSAGITAEEALDDAAQAAAAFLAEAAR
ncbi:alpha/beta family hydrolase [Oleispirillum naphthae]|uniref:alpha/beta family hydrolase n=1 Tax=Oleispirillum naphthae TaxID=2838853 RepID=UPI003082465A